MREKFKYAGQTVKTKQGVGINSFGQDMSGQNFVIDDWWENRAFGHIFHVNELEIEL